MLVIPSRARCRDWRQPAGRLTGPARHSESNQFASHCVLVTPPSVPALARTYTLMTTWQWPQHRLGTSRHSGSSTRYPHHHCSSSSASLGSKESSKGRYKCNSSFIGQQFSIYFDFCYIPYIIVVWYNCYFAIFSATFSYAIHWLRDTFKFKITLISQGRSWPVIGLS